MHGHAAGAPSPLSLTLLHRGCTCCRPDLAVDSVNHGYAQPFQPRLDALGESDDVLPLGVRHPTGGVGLALRARRRRPWPRVTSRARMLGVARHGEGDKVVGPANVTSRSGDQGRHGANAGAPARYRRRDDRQADGSARTACWQLARRCTSRREPWCPTCARARARIHATLGSTTSRAHSCRNHVRSDMDMGLPCE